MKNVKKGAVRKAIVLMMMAVFMAGGALTAYAEGEENGNTLTEYVIPADQVNHDHVVIMEDDGIVCYTTYPITWTVPAGRRYQTTVFHVDKNGPIVVNVVVKSGGASVRVGVEYPDLSDHYVLADGGMVHTFTADSSGDYSVFVENITDAEISVSGGYMF